MFVNDLKYAWRDLLRNRAVSIVVVISLAMAIGPNAALFSLVDQFLLTGGMWKAPDSLVEVYIGQHGKNKNLSYREYECLRQNSRSFSEIGLTMRDGGIMQISGVKEALLAEMVTANYFSLLRVDVALGRRFQPADDTVQDSAPVIISYGLWQRRFGGLADIIGKTLVFNGRNVTVVGVAERGFRGTGMAAIIDIWTPLERWLNPQMRKGESSYCDVYCMLRPGVTLAQAKLELRSISADLAKLYPDTNRGYEMVCFFTRADSMRARQVLSSMILLLAAMALAVACMNVCTLLLARAAGRERETAVRIAVGAGHRHIFRLLLVDGLLLSTLAAALGIIITRFLLMATPVLMPPSMPLTWKLDLDLKVLAYAALLALGTTFIFALTPAKLTYKLSVVGALKADMVGNRGKRRFSSFTLLIIAQIAISQALLCGAAVLLRSYSRNSQVQMGFDAKKPILLVTVVPQASGRDRAPVIQYRELIEKAAAIPGVKSATYAMNLPLNNVSNSYHVKTDPAMGGLDQYNAVDSAMVGPDYFKIIGTKLLYGRGFDRQDFHSQDQVVINKFFAGLAFPKLANPGDAIGRYLRTKEGDLRIIGIAEDGKYSDKQESNKPYMYVLAPETAYASTILLIETSGKQPQQLASEFRKLLSHAKPRLLIASISTLKEHVRLANYGVELVAMFVSAFGLLTLMLASVGLAGLAHYWVRHRKREIGIRLALGTTPGGIIRHMEIRALRPVLAGILIGMAIAIILERVISSMIFGVASFDIVGFAGSALFTFGVAAVATLIPTCQSGWVDPNSTLRQE